MKETRKSMATPANEENSKKTVSTQGKGIVNVTPDIALVSLGVETSNKEMSKAQSANKQLMNDIMSELKKLGIQDQDIQTENYSVYPYYEWENNRRKLEGYKVANTVRVKVRKIDDTGKVLDAVATKGANIVNGIEFSIDDTEEIYKDALKLAVKDAE